MSLSQTIEEVIAKTVKNVLEQRVIPEIPSDPIFTDNLAEVIEKLCIVHIRMWFLEDKAALATTDEDIANLKRKIDICFKQKRPQYVAAINAMADHAIKTNRSLVEDSVKLYAGFKS